MRVADLEIVKNKEVIVGRRNKISNAGMPERPIGNLLGFQA